MIAKPVCRSVAGSVVSDGYGSPFALDNVAAPAAAYSIARRLRSGYAGPLVRIRRDSDNAEQDFGVTDANVLDESAVTTFVGAGNGLVRTLYDQSGNERHLEQTATAEQHRFVLSGVIVKQNTKPAIECLNTRHMFTGASFSYTALTWCGVYRINADAGGLFQLGTAGTGASVYRATNLTARALTANGTATIANTLNTQYQGSATFTTAARRIWQNGVAGTQQVSAGTLNETSKELYFSALNPTTYRMQGYQQELIIWTTELPDASRVKIENDQNDFYGIY